MVARLNGITQAVNSRLAMHKLATNVFAGLLRNSFVLQMITQTDRFNIRERSRTNDNPKPSRRRICAPRPMVVVLLNILQVNVFELFCYGERTVKI